MTFQIYPLTIFYKVILLIIIIFEGLGDNNTSDYDTHFYCDFFNQSDVFVVT